MADPQVAVLQQVYFLLMLHSTTSTFYYLNDHLGTPQLLLDRNGRVVWQGDYHPFGRVDPGITTRDSDLRFPGQRYDQETGLHYNAMRYYDPNLGRYITPDPIGLAGGMNPYIYTGGDPVDWVDPWGLAGEALPGPVPLPIPPVAIPGTSENNAFVDSVIQGINAIKAALKNDGCKSGKCKPCIPSVGTIATEVHLVPPSKPHYPIEGSHVHWFKMQQSPYPMCKCFWKRNFQKPTPGNTTPPRTVPVTPAACGGPM